MKFNTVSLSLFILWFIFSDSATSQVQKPGLPPSFTKPALKSQVKLPEAKLKKLNVEQLLKEDEEFPTPLRYAVHEQLNVDIKIAGVMTELQDGRIWRYGIEGQNAKTLNVLFKQFHVPKGAELYIYDSAKEIIYGAFTEINNKAFQKLAIAAFPSNACILEYYEPWDVDFEGTLIVGSVGKGYRDITKYLNTPEDGLAPSLVDVNCPEGDDVQLEKHAVCRITFQEGRNNFLCSGALINNTSFNGIPYFLTANHCISSDSVAQTIVAYFNYERNQCDGNSIVSPNKTISGARLKATRGASDFTLLQLTVTPDVSFQPYYAGWSIKNEAPSYSYGIHHPSGAVKKISIDLDSALSYPFQINWQGQDVSPANSHWQVIFDVGLTEGGSSGSPLFNQNNKIVGQLHGGSEGVDYYGKISESWDGLFTSRALKFWLDPENSDVEELEGFVPDGIKPDAHFSASLQNACVTAPVQLVDKSAFEPNSWEWAITPETATFIEGTNENSENPVISFNEPGAYSVSLLATNDAGYNLQTFEDFIVTGTEIQVSYLLSAQQSICFRNFEDYEILASGAEDYTWSLFSQDAKDFLELSAQEELAVVNLKDNVSIDTSLQTTILLLGQHGACLDSSTIDLNILFPFNDDISNAYPLKLGQNGPFSNECATKQENEPIPPIGDCNSQFSWCDEYRDGTRIVENSLWFTFKGPSTGIAAVETDGFDNQIAIYEADVYQDIISGTPLLYEILAANDDYIDADYSATIKQVKVTPGKTYWIQMDGSQGGMEGVFTLTLFDSPILTNNNHKELSDQVQVYPNPANTNASVFIGDEFADANDEVTIVLSTLNGQVIYSNTTVLHHSRYDIDIQDFTPGIYVIHVYSETKYYSNKLFVE